MSPSLRDRIKEAPSAAAVDELLAEGQLYAHASAKTRRRWEQAAARRKEELCKS